MRIIVAVRKLTVWRKAGVAAAGTLGPNERALEGRDKSKNKHAATRMTFTLMPITEECSHLQKDL